MAGRGDLWPGRVSGAWGCAALVAWALLVASAMGAWTAPHPVSYQSVEKLVNVSGGTYALLPHTALNGTVVRQGAANIQASTEACAASCSATPGCNGFGFCPGRPCPFSGLELSPQGACQLMAVASQETGTGPLSIATGNSSLGDAGVRILIDKPDPSAFPGYELLFAQGLPTNYFLPCNDSLGDQGCIVISPLQSLLERCTAWPDCQAVVLGPGLLGSSVATPLAAFGGLKTRAPLNRSDTILSPFLYTLVKLGWESPDGGGSGLGKEQASSGGLSAGAIAGIAVGAAVLVAVVAGGAWLVFRRRRLQETQQRREAGEGPGGAVREEPARSDSAKAVADVWQRLGGEESASKTAKSLAGLVSEAQLSEVIIPSANITLATRGGVPFRLGGGASGDVYLARLGNSASVAVKMFDFSRTLSQPKDFIEEAVMLRRLNHPHLVQFLGVSIINDGALCEGGLTMSGERGLLVMELAAGDLWSVLQEGGPGGQYTWYKKGRRVALAVASALQYLHSQQVLHMDIKPQNVLLFRDGTAKVSDVGFSRIMSASRSHISCLGRFGTLTWCAPEVLMGAKATKAADMYSFGIVLWQLCTGVEPGQGDIRSLQAPEQCPLEIAALQTACCNEDPAQRPTAEEVVGVLTSNAKPSSSMHRLGTPDSPTAIASVEEGRSSAGAAGGSQRAGGTGSSSAGTSSGQATRSWGSLGGSKPLLPLSASSSREQGSQEQGGGEGSREQSCLPQGGGGGAGSGPQLAGEGQPPVPGKPQGAEEGGPRSGERLGSGRVVMPLGPALTIRRTAVIDKGEPIEVQSPFLQGGGPFS